MYMARLPHVSCVMVTRGRPDMALNRVQDFLRQDYEPKDLVIVADGGIEDRRLRHGLEGLDCARITLVEVPLGRLSLGALRNLSVRSCQGDAVCQWDDDDMYHPGRLSRQVAHMTSSGAPACVLGDQLHLFTSTNTLYWCDWRSPRDAPEWAPGIPNTLICAKSHFPLYPEVGRCAVRAEDMQVMMQLHSIRLLSILCGSGTSYVYVNHGSNTWSHSHHDRIVRITGLTRRQLLSRQACLTADLRAYSLPGFTVVRAYDDDSVFRLTESGALDPLPHPSNRAHPSHQGT